ncbi:MAG: ribosome silencing factor [Acidimicrobiia bacterium]|nr:ribosome silencing factor [Acidimicrobiia bacterium]
MGTARVADPQEPASQDPGADPHEYQRHLAITAARAADALGASEIVVLDVADVTAVADFFVIASGRSDRQVGAVVDEVESRLCDEGVSALSVEGADGRSWVLLNFGGIVVHVFDEEMRAFYSLERLWRDAPRVTWEPPEAS